MVRFLEDPEQYKTCEMIERIDSSIQRYAIGNLDVFSSLERVKCQAICEKLKNLMALLIGKCAMKDHRVVTLLILLTTK